MFYHCILTEKHGSLSFTPFFLTLSVAWGLTAEKCVKMQLSENEDYVIMRLLRNREVDGMRQCYRKS